MPTAPIKALIESIASRNNYGLEISDLPDGLREGVAEVPVVRLSAFQLSALLFSCRCLVKTDPQHSWQGLQLPSWEVHDEENLPAEFESKLAKRKADRVQVSFALPPKLVFIADSRATPIEQIKTLSAELFLALSSEEQNDLLHSKKPSKGSKGISTPVASTSKSKKADTGSSATKPAKASVKKEKVKKEKSAEELAEEEEKAKVKREKEKEKEIKRIAKEKAVSWSFEAVARAGSVLILFSFAEPGKGGQGCGEGG